MPLPVLHTCFNKQAAKMFWVYVQHIVSLVVVPPSHPLASSLQPALACDPPCSREARGPGTNWPSPSPLGTRPLGVRRAAFLAALRPPFTCGLHCRSGAPLATRWSPASNTPWQVTLPLTPEVPGGQALQVSLGVAVEPWVYKAGLATGLAGAHRTAGPRVVVLQVVEGERKVTLPGGGVQHGKWPDMAHTDSQASVQVCLVLCVAVEPWASRQGRTG
jgi:hypothetical protein